jgi:ERCC4-type nuclease
MNNDIEIIIDNRENKIKEFFNNILKNNYNIITAKELDLNNKLNNIIKYENLDLGDIVIKYKGNIKYIIERKTLKDLGESIKDNRYHEQKQRMKYTLDKNIKIIYLFESFFGYDTLTKEIEISNLKGNTILSAILSTTIREDYGILLTKNVNETVWLLKEIFKRMLTNSTKYFIETEYNIQRKKSNDNINNCLFLKRRKKDNITKDNILIISLSQIPGISEKIAKAISKHFNNMNDFFIKLNNLNHIDKINYLKDITYTVKDNKVRKLGKKHSENIINLYFS